MNDLLASPVFGVCVTLAAYLIGVRLNLLEIKGKKPFAAVPPIVFAVFLLICLLVLCKIPTASYAKGGSMVSFWIAPATVLLAVPIYNRRDIIRRNALAVLAGCAAGSAVNALCVIALCRAFGIERELTVTLLPKSVTTPIAMGVSEMLGGVPEITAAAVIFTGFLGAAFAPFVLKFAAAKSQMAKGIAIGTSSHVLGTSRAMQMGELCGACSGAAIGICGLMTVLAATVYGMIG